jgi:hypothetical protein
MRKVMTAVSSPLVLLFLLVLTAACQEPTQTVASGQLQDTNSGFPVDVADAADGSKTDAVAKDTASPSDTAALDTGDAAGSDSAALEDSDTAEDRCFARGFRRARRRRSRQRRCGRRRQCGCRELCRGRQALPHGLCVCRCRG